MSIREERIKRAAEAICLCLCETTDHWKEWTDEARAALTADAAALAEAERRGRIVGLRDAHEQIKARYTSELIMRDIARSQTRLSVADMHSDRGQGLREAADFFAARIAELEAAPAALEKQTR